MMFQFRFSLYIFLPCFPLVNNQQKFSNFTTPTDLTELSCLEGIIFSQSIMPQLDKFTYFTQFFWSCLFLFTFYIPICNDGDGVLGISRILKLIKMEMNEGSFSGKRKRLEGKDSLIAFGGSGSDGDEDPHKRKRKAVSKSCIDTSVNLIREIILNLIVDTTNNSLRSGLNNPNNQVWNNGIRTALDERFGHSLYNWRRVAQLVTVTSEITLRGEESPFFLRVLQIVKDR